MSRTEGSQKFQFLIGRLITKNKILQILAIRVFQFLIGRLITLTEVRRLLANLGVSIPHR